MKLAYFAFTAFLAASPVLAQSTNGNTNVSGSGATANIYSKGGKSGPASAIAPSVTSTLGSCVVYLPLGLSVTTFGASSGIPIQDAACNRREKARTILQVTGSRAAATNMLCMDREMRQALGAACGGGEAQPARATRTAPAARPRTVSDAKYNSCMTRASRNPDIKPASCNRYR